MTESEIVNRTSQKQVKHQTPQPTHQRINLAQFHTGSQSGRSEY